MKPYKLDLLWDYLITEHYVEMNSPPRAWGICLHFIYTQWTHTQKT